ncbi:signal peptidase I [uncultured Streptococcus sp.]|uniref:signal peptidase I n=1 Tax=uncultured Streptococcus sp. TaxID=83427 RepID=UPI001A3DDF04|nr:signal peptidase I [uncultured Streptococcus sp.]VTY17181.1 Signal peptidase I P [uncultured Streptococcus sp.]
MKLFKRFLKEWGGIILIMTLLVLSRLFLWSNVRVEGHSMDPTLADGEVLFVVKHLPINRFDIVVAHEDEGNKDIVKRVIGLPGDTIRYQNDKLYVNGNETNEPYLADYIKRFKDDKLQSTYSGTGFEGDKGTFFRSIAQKAQAFTVDVNYNTNFSFTVPEGEYLLLGDDRLVSSDSRHVGTFKAKDITGEAKFRLWPMNRIGTF